jgi:UDP-N-acetylmuramate-alanine ligase
MVAAVAVEARPGDLVLTMGAGDIYRAADLILDQLGRAQESGTKSG